MKLLVIGSGGREHALSWKLANSPRVQKVFVAPGNGGTATENGVENVALTEIGALVDFCRKENIYLTVVGPEAPLDVVLVVKFLV
jgi:phosphoribosylamine--glycine ligase